MTPRRWLALAHGIVLLTGILSATVRTADASVVVGFGGGGSSPPGPQGDRDVGEIAVIEVDPTIVLPGEPFDLRAKTVIFSQRPEGGYSIAIEEGRFEDAGARLEGPFPQEIGLGFTMPFFATTHHRVFVNANGTLTFGGAEETRHFNPPGGAVSELGEGSTVLDAFAEGLPRVAALWQAWDLALGGAIAVNAHPERLVVTWQDVKAHPWSSGGVTFQVVVDAEGTVRLTYPASVPNHAGGYLVGIAPGNTFRGMVTTVDLSRGAGGSVSTLPAFEALAQVFGSTSTPYVHLPAVAQHLYRAHDDRFDQVVVWTHFSQAMGRARAFNQLVRQTVGGIGRELQRNVDLSSMTGSAGALHSLVSMGDASMYPADPSAPLYGQPSYTPVTLLAHEAGHQWLASVRFDDGGVCRDDLLGRGASHWSFFHDTDGSVMEGNDWPDTIGRFTSGRPLVRYSALDQYLMGLRAPADVGPFFFVADPSSVSCTVADPDLAAQPERSCAPREGMAVDGTRTNVTVQQIIGCATNGGSRVPPSGFTAVNPTTTWRQAFVLVVRPEAAATIPYWIQRVDGFRRGWSEFFTIATDGRGSVTTLLRDPRTLAVTAAGTGSGTVTSQPAGVDCGTACSARFSTGTMVTLTVTPARGSRFVGWSGACSGTAPCTTTLTADTTVVASFAAIPSGNDAADPLPISATSFADARDVSDYPVLVTDPLRSCTGRRDSRTVWYRFTPAQTGVATIATTGSAYDTVVSVHVASTLAEVPRACSDDGAPDRTSRLEVTLSAGTTYLIAVSAFAAEPGGRLAFSFAFAPSGSTATVTVTRSGSGSGFVRASSFGIDCGAVCAYAYPAGASVTLTAAPAYGSRFEHWDGPCGTATFCVVNLRADARVTAVFSRMTADVAVRIVAPDLVVPVGGHVAHAVVVTNRGPDAAQAVVLRYTVPVGRRLVPVARFATDSFYAPEVIAATAVPDRCAVSGETVVCQLGDLVSGAAVTVPFVLTAGPAGTLTALADVSTASADPDAGTNRAIAATTVDGPGPIVGTIAVGRGARRAVTVAGGREVYVSNPLDGTVSVIDTATHTVVRTIGLAGEPDAIAASPDGATVYVGNRRGGVAVIDTRTRAVRTVDTARGPVLDLAVTPDGRGVYLAMGEAGLKRLDPATSTVRVVASESCARALVLVPENQVLYVAYGCDAFGAWKDRQLVGVFDVARAVLLETRYVGDNGGAALAIAPGGERMWVNGGDACIAPGYGHGCPTVGAGVVTVMSPTGYASEAVRIGFTGFAPDLVTISPDGGLAVVGNGAELLLFDAVNVRLARSLPLGGSGAVAFAADGRHAYAPIPDEGVVAVVDLAPRRHGRLLVEATTSPAGPVVGTPLTYRLRVTNTGPDALGRVRLTDVAPEGFEVTSSAASQGDCDTAAVVRCDVGEIAAGASVTLTIVAVPRTGGRATNVAWVIAGAPDRGVASVATVTTSVTVRAEPSVSALASVHPVTARVGGAIAFGVRFINTGTDPVAVRMTEWRSLGAELIGTFATHGQCAGETTVVCELGTLPAGAVATVVITARPSTPGTVTSSMVVAYGGRHDLLSASATVTDGTPGLSATLKPPTWFAPDPTQELPFVAVVSNGSDKDVTEVRLVEVLPPVLEFVRAVPSQGGCEHAHGVLTCQLGTIPGRRGATVAIVTRPGLISADQHVTKTVDVTGLLGTATPVAASATAALTIGPPRSTLRFTYTGIGGGRIVAPAVLCSASCTVPITRGQTLTLTAVADAGSTFEGWGGACTGTGSCVVTLDGDRSLTVRFTAAPMTTLTVTAGGFWGGLVTTTSGTALCVSPCGGQSRAVALGSTMTLTVVPATGAVFRGWTGDCLGSGPCVLTMTEPKTVRALFAPASVVLSVGRAGSGAGRIVTTPAGIDCADSCWAGFAPGTAVTLVPVPDAGAVFLGWSGACSGARACVVTIGEATHVTAIFAAAPRAVSVVKTGGGAGRVTSTPGGIDCGRDCREVFTASNVVLTAVPDAGSVFAGWRDTSCGPATVCTVATGAHTVTAVFEPAAPDVVVALVKAVPAATEPGGRLTLHVSVQNRAPVATAATTVRLYLSRDARRGADVAIGPAVRIPALAPAGVPRASSTRTMTMAVPRESIGGSYFVLACVEDGSADAERCTAAPVSVAVGRADVVVERAVAARTTVAGGHRMSVTATVRNAGSAPSRDATLQLSLRPAGSDGASLGRALASQPLGTLTPGVRRGVELRLTIGKDVPAGAYEIVACVTRDGADRRCAASSPIVVAR